MSALRDLKHSKALDVCWALLTAISAVGLIFTASGPARVLAWASGVVEFAAAGLFLVRRPPQLRCPNACAAAVALASVFSVLAFRKAAPAHNLEPLSIAANVVGLALYAGALWSLGKSFAVLPGCRGVQDGGLYRWIRHPLYAAYVVLDLGIVLAVPTLWNALSFAVAIALFVWRIRIEEALLCRLSAYRRYARHVRWRLVPGLF